MRNMLAAAVVPLLVSASAFAQEIVYQPGKDIRSPVLVREVKPNYTGDAMRRKVQGVVELTAVVKTDGTVGDTHVVKSLDPDLDQEAVKATKQWQFKPGTKDGEPVNVQVSIELAFTLRDGPPAPVYTVGNGVSAPVAIKTVNPDYEDSAREERIQGTVELEGVVEPNGAVTNMRVVKSLDSRLDSQAMKAFAQWRFKPGAKDDVAVRVRVHVEMSFSLK